MITNIILNLMPMSMFIFNMLFSCFNTYRLITIKDHLKTATVEPEDSLDL